MSLTFRDYIIAEAAGMDPSEMSHGERVKSHVDKLVSQDENNAAKQDHIVDLVSNIKRVMGGLDLAAGTEHGEHAYTFIDLIEALTTLEEVAMSRLSAEGAHTKKGFIQTQGKELWKGDEANDFERFFDSIGDEAKDAIRNVFAMPGSDKGEKARAPRFILAFNNLIVDRVMDVLKEVGPERALEILPGVIHAAKQAVVQQQQTRGTESTMELKQLMQQYRIARNRTVGRKSATSRTRQDRSRLKQTMSELGQ